MNLAMTYHSPNQTTSASVTIFSQLFFLSSALSREEGARHYAALGEALGCVCAVSVRAQKHKLASHV